MKASYLPGIFDKHRMDQCIQVDAAEAFAMVRRLAREEGLFVGVSSGAALAGALRAGRELSGGDVVVIFPDGGDPRLSTGVLSRASPACVEGCIHGRIVFDLLRNAKGGPTNYDTAFVRYGASRRTRKIGNLFRRRS
ncbi:MAG: pyridoxal-phosphate dependent enzyme [Desulfobacterales bacterium]|nr:pyridoxal-phosphate dependent enzyme [Desulfobacterales bacterium]